MKDKLDKRLLIGAAVSVLAMIVGYLLWTNLLPIQDIDTMTALEAAEARKELAINHPLGTILMNTGFVAFFLCLAVYSGRRLFGRKKKK